MIRSLALLLLLSAPVSASARVSMSDANGFLCVHEAVLAAPPAEVWARLTAWSSWWPASHSYSGKAENLSLDPQAGGLLVERWDRGSVTHATVLTAMPARLLRLSGGFGPLQPLPVNAILDISLAPQGAGTLVKMSYRVGGPGFVDLPQYATPVDAVLAEAFTSLTAR